MQFTRCSSENQHGCDSDSESQSKLIYHQQENNHKVFDFFPLIPIVLSGCVIIHSVHASDCLFLRYATLPSCTSVIFAMLKYRLFIVAFPLWSIKSPCSRISLYMPVGLATWISARDRKVRGSSTCLSLPVIRAIKLVSLQDMCIRRVWTERWSPIWTDAHLENPWTWTQVKACVHKRPRA